MGTCRALIFAGAALVGAMGAAHAADLPPPPVMYAPAPEPVAFGGWYLRGDVGVGSSFDSDFRSSFDAGFEVPDDRYDHTSLGDSAFGGGGFGYQFNSWLRFDVTGEYRTSQSISAVESYDCSAFGCGPAGSRAYDKYSGSTQSIVALFNAYADLGTWYGFTPFIGAGVGASFNSISSITDQGVNGANGFGVGGFGFSQSRHDTDLAWAAMAGVSYAISPNLKLELAYRYLDMGDISSGAIVCQNTPSCGNEIQRIHLASQDVRLGMRWYFTDVAVPAPIYAPPLVRKD